MIRPRPSYAYLRRMPLGQLLLIAAVAVVALYLLAFAAFVGTTYVRHRRAVRRRLERRRRAESVADELAAAVGSPAELDRILDAAYADGALDVGDEALVEACRRTQRSAALTQRLSDRGAVGRLLEGTSSEEVWKRVLALEALRLSQPPEALAAFERAGMDPSPEVRRSGREGLLSVGTPAAIRLLMASLLVEFPARPDWRGGYFARIPGQAAGALLDLLRDGGLDARQQKLALELLGDAAEPQAGPLARECLTSDDPEKRATAARVLGKLGQETAGVGALLSDREWWVRAAAARAFESMAADANGLATLETCLSEREWWVRSNAARALACQGQAGLAILFSVLEDEDSDKDARDSAHSALSSADLPAAVRARLESLVRRRLQGAGPRRDLRRRPRGAA